MEVFWISFRDQMCFLYANFFLRVVKKSKQKTSVEKNKIFVSLRYESSLFIAVNSKCKIKSYNTIIPNQKYSMMRLSMSEPNEKWVH